MAHYRVSLWIWAGTIHKPHTWEDEYITGKDGKQEKNRSLFRNPPSAHNLLTITCRLPKILKNAGEWKYRKYKDVSE